MNAQIRTGPNNELYRYIALIEMVTSYILLKITEYTHTHTHTCIPQIYQLRPFQIASRELGEKSDQTRLSVLQWEPQPLKVIPTNMVCYTKCNNKDQLSSPTKDKETN